MRVGAAVMGIAVTATAGTGIARAADQPSIQELLDACNRADVCEFHPKSLWKSVSEERQVGDSVWNCSSSDQQLQVTWSDTKGSSNTVGVAIEVGYSFFKVLEASLQTSYSYTWEISHTWGETAQLNVPGSNVGWLTRGAPMVNTMGQYELHFPKRYYGHYYWYINNYTQTGPDASGVAQLSYHHRPMTAQEVTAHCSSANPEGTTTGAETGAEPLVVDETVPAGDDVMTQTLTRGQSEPAPTNAISVSSGE